MLPSSAQLQLKLQLSGAEFDLFPLSPTTQLPSFPPNPPINLGPVLNLLNLTENKPCHRWLSMQTQLVVSYLPASLSCAGKGKVGLLNNYNKVSS